MDAHRAPVRSAATGLRPQPQYQVRTEQKSHQDINSPNAMKQKPKNWTDQEKQALVKLARQGLSVREVASRLKRYPRSVKQMAEELKVVLRKQNLAPKSK